MEHLTEVSQLRATWIASLTEEERAAMTAERTRSQTEEGKAETMAEMVATF